MAGMKPRLLDLFWGPAMGIDWMTSDELAEAIPPAYTEYIGYYLMAHLNAEKAAA
jgi:DNA (cytosine-5)-methyltransferase 1